MGIEQNIGRERKGTEEQKEKESNSIIYNSICIIIVTPYVKHQLNLASCQTRTSAQTITQPDTNTNCTTRHSHPIKHAGSEYPGGDDDWDWEMSLRYKYPTINTDTYRMNGNRTEDR